MKKWVLISIILVLLAFVFTLFAARWFVHNITDYQEAPDLNKKTYLQLDLSRDYPESPKFSFRSFRFQRKISFRKMLKSIENAAQDEKIKGIIIRPHQIKLNHAQIDELISQLKQFKEEGKKCFLFMNQASMSSMLFSSVADRTVMPPTGTMFIPGISISPTLFKGSMDKLGIKWKVIKKGKYKNALESFTSDSLSDESRKVYNSIADQFYTNFLRRVEKGTGIEKDSLDSLINKSGIFLAEEGVELNLIDTVDYYNDFKNSLDLEKGENLFSVKRYSRKESNFDFRRKGKIALVYALGNIHLGESQEGVFGRSNSIGSQTYSRILTKVIEDDEIEAIVLRVESPGGSAEASDIIWHTLQKAKDKKPVVVSMGGVAASGGYYISMGADKIVASPNTLTGSVGVIFGMPNLKGLYDKLGIRKGTIKRGKNANIFSEYKKMTAQQESLMAKYISETYSTFVNKAAEGVGLKADSMHKLAQGRVWTGEQAYQTGLVDSLGGLDLAIDIAKELADLPREKKVKIIRFPKGELNFNFMGGVQSGNKILDELLPSVMKFRYFGKYEPLYLMPYDFSDLRN